MKALRPLPVAFEYEALPGRRGLKLFKWFSVQHMVGHLLLAGVAVRIWRVLCGGWCWFAVGKSLFGAGCSVSSHSGVASELNLFDSCTGGEAALDGDALAVRFGKLKGTCSGC